MLKTIFFPLVFLEFWPLESVVGRAPWPLGDVLGRSWRLSKACQVPSRVTETYLERSWTSLERSWTRFWAVLTR